MLRHCDCIQSFLFSSYSLIYKTKILFCIRHWLLTLRLFLLFFPYLFLTFFTKHVIEPWGLLWVWSNLSVQNTEPIECNSWFVRWCAIVTIFSLFLFHYIMANLACVLHPAAHQIYSVYWWDMMFIQVFWDKLSQVLGNLDNCVSDSLSR